MSGLTRFRWWAILIRGIAAVLFGMVALFRPGLSLALLVVLFGAYALVDGLFAIVAAFRNDGGTPWWALLIEGFAGIAVAAITVLMPAIGALTLLYLVAAWSVVTGIAEIAAAVRLRRIIGGEWLLGLSGLLSVAFGVLIVARPIPGLVTLVWLIGIYAVLFGGLLIGLSFRVRKVENAVFDLAVGHAL